ncbi:RING finger protein 44-like [Pseudophryne corroboree]|uniref:RING finger protein 44-like n=1 Tax=Pseudophryne corroboree TaxID=495146 RepID=UPI00308197C9
MSRRELRRLLEDQRRWRSRHGDPDDASETVFEERLRSERRGERRARQDQRPQRENRERSHSPLPDPDATDRPRPDHLPGHLHLTFQQPAENGQDLLAMVVELTTQNLPAFLVEIRMRNLPPMMMVIGGQDFPPMEVEISGHNLPATVTEINEQNLPVMEVEISGFPSHHTTEDEATQACVICLMEFGNGERVTVLPCSHKYHTSCIYHWTDTNPSCPVCRRDCIPRPVLWRIS